jgi:hypothetical protein
MAWGQRLDDANGRMFRQTMRQQISGLTGPYEGTGQHHINRQVECRQSSDCLLEPRNPAIGQWPQRIIWPLWALCGGDGVPHEVELDRAH